MCPVGVDSGGERSYVGTAAQAARKTPKRTVTMTSANKMTIGEQEKENFVHLRLNYGDNFPENFTGIAEYPNGEKEWYKNGLRHREDGPAVEDINGYKAWYKEGKIHRLDGPAVEGRDGHKEWCLEGKCHRLDGPACEWADGTKEWYLNGKRYSEEDWKVKVQELKEPKMETLKVKSTSEIPKNFTGVVEYPNGGKVWYKEGKLHREDGPAKEYPNGHKEWWFEGKRHRTDGPAVEYSDGEKHWYKEGKLHREGGPAIERVNGTKHWYKEDKLHREDGPAKEYADGTKYWFKEGYQYFEEEWKVKVQELKEPKTKVLKLKNHESPPQNFTGIVEHRLATKIWYKQGKWHREDGPAKTWADGDGEWWVEGKLHREDGPACEYANGDKNWYLEGREYSEKDWNAKIQELKEPKMKTIKVKSFSEIPKNFTGIVERPDGSKYWYKNGMYNREDGPAIEYSDGGVWWYLEGQEYSEEEFNEKITKAAVKKIEPIILKLDWDTPVPFLHTGIAEFPNGTKFWYKDGNLHREDGPAKEYSSGRKHWWLDGKEYSEEEFSRVTTKRAPLTVSPVVVKSEPTTASEPEKQEPTTTKETPEMTSMDKAKAIILSDASIVAQRVAVEQVAKQIQNMIIGLLVSKQKGRQKTAMKTQLEEFFSSKAGSATIKFIAGLALPRVAEYAAKYGLLKPQHLVVVETLATELRIQGETDAALEVMEALSPLVSMLTSGLTAQFESMMNSFAEAPAENLRIDVGGNQNQSSQDHEMESGFVSQKVATG